MLPIFPPTQCLENREREDTRSFLPQHRLPNVKTPSLSVSSIIKIESRVDPWQLCLPIMNGEANLLGTGAPVEQAWSIQESAHTCHILGWSTDSSNIYTLESTCYPTRKQDHFTKHMQAVKPKRLRYWEHKYLCQKSSVSYSNRKARIQKENISPLEIKWGYLERAKWKVIPGTEILKQGNEIINVNYSM